MPSRAALLVILVGLVPLLGGQNEPGQIPPIQHGDPAPEVRLPNGKLQSEEILKSDRERSIQDVKQLVEDAQALERDLEQKDSQQVLNLNDIHRTEEIEKLAKRIRGRMRRN